MKCATQGLSFSPLLSFLIPDSPDGDKKGDKNPQDAKVIAVLQMFLFYRSGR